MGKAKLRKPESRLGGQYAARKFEIDDIGNHSSKISRKDVLDPHPCVYQVLLPVSLQVTRGQLEVSLSWRRRGQN